VTKKLAARRNNSSRPRWLKLSSASVVIKAASTAATSEYHRRVNRTSITGLTRNDQNAGDTATAVIEATVASGTCRVRSTSGITTTRIPKNMPRTEALSPISHTGARVRRVTAIRKVMSARAC
jgi:hypothetical protein